MAEFSKQYCELNNMGFDGDFDIMEELEELEDGHYMSLICEGFGFIAIEVGLDGEIYLIFDSGLDGVDKVHYQKFMEKQKLKSVGI